VELARSQRPSLVMMDIRLGGVMDGIESARTIRRETKIPVVFLTAHCDSATLDRAGLADPFGYILKPFDRRDLRVQIELALCRHAAEQKSSLAASPAAAAPSALPVAELTPRQVQVLRLIAEGHAGKSIARLLNISPKTVEYHKALLMKQLDLHTTAELTRYAIKHGLIAAD
jgi:DNA-binding NarL/FixJ family response regulator